MTLEHIKVLYKQLAGFFFLGLALLQTPAAYALDFPVPEFFKLSIVAEDMSYSGISMSVSQFNSKKGVADIRRFYERQWPQTRVVEQDELFVISHLDEKRGLLFSVQVSGDWRHEDQPEGFLAVSDLPAHLSGKRPELPVKGLGFPLHVSGNVVNDMRFHDARKQSRFMYITHSANARTIHDHYLRSLQNRGWSLLNSTFDPREHRGVIRFQKGTKRMDITLAFQDSATQMTVVELN